MPLAAILLATGRAPWSGQAFAMLPWDDERTLVEYQIEQLRGAGIRDVEVVLGFEADRVIPLISADNVEAIVDAGWIDPASSLRVGASAVVRGTTAAIVIDVTTPRPAGMLIQLIDAHVAGGREIAVPTFEGTRGAPSVFGEQALAALRNVRGGDGLLSVFRRFEESTVEVPFERDVVLLQVDSSEGYESAKQRLG